MDESGRRNMMNYSSDALATSLADLVVGLGTLAELWEQRGTVQISNVTRLSGASLDLKKISSE